MEDKLRYPIGKFSPKETYSSDEVAAYIERIEKLPARLAQAIDGLTDKQLDTPYRDGGWTVRQVVHHVADSHTNAYVRTKWTLTENAPTIKAYEEKQWAETPETDGDPQMSIAFLKALHVKWVLLFRQLSPADLEKHFIHPETHKAIRLNHLTGLYAWHGEHHLAHITSLKERMKW